MTCDWPTSTLSSRSVAEMVLPYGLQRQGCRPRLNLCCNLSRSKNNFHRVESAYSASLAMLCSACEAVIRAGPDTEFDDGERIGQFKKRFYYQCGNDLIRAAAQGCYICARVRRRQLSIWGPNGVCPTPRYCYSDTIPGPLDAFLSFDVSPESQPSQDLCVFQVVSIDRNEDDLLPVLSRDDTHTGSDRSLVTVQSWLKDCEGNHTACKEGCNNWTPTRLLEIVTASDNAYHTVRLINPSGHSRKPYAALSHCW